MLSSLERNVACWLLAITIFVGFTVPGLSEMMAPFTSISLLILIVMSLLPMGRMDESEVFSLDSKVWQIVLWQLLVLPGIIVSGAHLARVDSNITLLMVTTASAGSLFASPTFAELLQVNKQKALQCMVLSTFLMPISYFIFFTLVLHAEVEIDILSFVYRCMIYLVMPLGIFLIYMGIVGDLPDRFVNKIESFSRRTTIAALMVFGLGIIGPARELLWSEPSRFSLYLVIVTGLGAGMAYLTAIVMFKQGMNDSLTASIVSGFRNVGLGFVLLSGIAGETSAEYVGVSQIPNFLAPLALTLFVSRQRKSADAKSGVATAPATA
jgi:predicted Na+-dependent transporter